MHNPYAPSSATLTARKVTAPSEGVRRDGKWVVVPRDTDLPHRCVKCNAAPHEPTKKRTLYWHHPAVYLVILLNIVIYVIVAMAVRKNVKLSPALCATHKSKRRKAILGAWLGVITSIALPILFADNQSFGVWLLISIVLFLGSAIAGIVRSRILYAKKIDASEGRFGGAGREFLESLPG